MAYSVGERTFVVDSHFKTPSFKTTQEDICPRFECRKAPTESDMETCENDQGQRDLNVLKRVFTSTVVIQRRFASARAR
jgi:hypothetical protein